MCDVFNLGEVVVQSKAFHKTFTGDYVMRKINDCRAGFTLVELLVVIVILGILAGIGVQLFVDVHSRAEDKAHEANVRVLKSALHMWMLANPGPDRLPLQRLTKNYDGVLSEYLELPFPKAKHPSGRPDSYYEVSTLPGNTEIFVGVQSQGYYDD